MELLTSNFQPVQRSGSKDFATAWLELFLKSDQILICVGYASVESLLYLKDLIRRSPPRELSICLGMARFDGLTHNQLQAASELHDALMATKSGGVSIAFQFPFHGKMQLFSHEENIVATLVGSSNLTNIVPLPGTARGNYECDVLMREPELCSEVEIVILDLLGKASTPLPEALKYIDVIQPRNSLMDGQNQVKSNVANKYKSAQLQATGNRFRIPIKTAAKSNLNTYFGKGRVGPQGFEKPRHWYEVEIIVDLSIKQGGSGYPKPKSDFVVYTDDGYGFVATTNGDYGKNLRSRDDLRILGRWLKGRMEIAGALESGKPVTAEVLERYGRSTLTLTQTSVSEFDDVTGLDLPVWLMNFDPNEK